MLNMAAAFPITIKAVEALAVKDTASGEFRFDKKDKVFRAICVVQLVALSYILILQIFLPCSNLPMDASEIRNIDKDSMKLIVPVIFENKLVDEIVCEAWLNIFYSIGLFCGIYTNLYPTNTGIACYIGLEGLIAFLAFHKLYTDTKLELDSNPFNKLWDSSPTPSAGVALIFWTTLAVGNALVFLCALLLLTRYAYAYRCNCMASNTQSDV